MAITAALVKELRERTGAGMMDCKKALVETNADLEAAIDLMRASGAAKAAKKAGRVASEGLVSVTISEDKMHAAILEVNSETDFVTKGSAFIDFVDTLGALALKNKPESVEIFSEQKLDSGVTVDQAREEIIAKIGENISVRRVQIVSTESGVLGAYKHGERIAVLTVLSSNDAELAKDIAMHIAASKPECVSEDQLSTELLEREKAIFIEQAKESGKPDNIIEKIELKFSFESPQTINYYEKIIVYFLLAIGATNSDKKFRFPDKHIEDICYEHLKEVSSKLYEIGIIKEDILSIGTATKAKSARGVFGLVADLPKTDLYTASGGNTSSFYLIIDNDARKELLKKIILNNITAQQTTKFILNLTQDSLNYFNKYYRFIPELNHAPDLTNLFRIFNG